MRTLPTTMVQEMAPFVPLFSERVWAHVRLLLAGAILAPGKEDRSFRPQGGGSATREVLLPLPSGLEPCSRGRAGKQAAYCSGCSLRLSSLRDRWSWASTRP